MLDPDTVRFEGGLKKTRPGLRLGIATNESRIAINQIRALQVGTMPPLEKRLAIDSWRQSYIRACEHASQAIDMLWDEYHWPQDGARKRDYIWQPMARRRR